MLGNEPRYQDSVGRNADVDPRSAGFSTTCDFVAGVGLSGRAWVLDEPARLQPRVAKIATVTMSVRERVAMLILFTPSPETESPETSPCLVREPSAEAEAASPGEWSSSEWCAGARGIALHDSPTYV